MSTLPLGVRMMRTADLLALASFDADAYCSTCQGQILISCHCGARTTPYPVGPTTVGDLLDAKRRGERYLLVLDWVREDKPDRPLHLCFYGRCLTDGHHRVTAAVDCQRQEMAVAQDFEQGAAPCCCDPYAGADEDDEYEGDGWYLD